MLAKEVPSVREILAPVFSSLPTELYDPKAFITHAAWLGQACAHCPIFLTAASRRSGDRVSVPLWLTTLSGQLPVIGLVCRYHTNYLMGRSLLLQRLTPFLRSLYSFPAYAVLASVSARYPAPEGR